MTSFNVTLDIIENNVAILLVRDGKASKNRHSSIFATCRTQRRRHSGYHHFPRYTGTEAAKERVTVLLEKLQNKNRD